MPKIKDPVPVQFAKLDGGRIVLCSGILEEIMSEFIRVTFTDDEGEHHVRFRRAPGAKAGWGVGPSRFWRITSDERKRYCHPDVPLRLRR